MNQLPALKKNQGAYISKSRSPISLKKLTIRSHWVPNRPCCCRLDVEFVPSCWPWSPPKLPVYLPGHRRYTYDTQMHIIWRRLLLENMAQALPQNCLNQNVHIWTAKSRRTFHMSLLEILFKPSQLYCCQAWEDQDARYTLEDLAVALSPAHTNTRVRTQGSAEIWIFDASSFTHHFPTAR